MAGKHAGGSDELVGTLPILDGLVDAVEAERRNAAERGASARVDLAYKAASDHLRTAGRLIRDARKGTGNE